jgi:HD-GYP domain-containing protein (c-di-GMP phosphodiesterase class II)
MTEKYRKIEDISSIKTACYVTDNKEENKGLIGYLTEDLGIDLKLISNTSDITGTLTPPKKTDIFFIDTKIQGDSEAGIKVCHHLRKNGYGYKGVIILCMQKESVDDISSSLITSIGFDNFVPLKCGLKVLLNQLHWAILNRRRKNKNILQFDNNPDALYTIDKSGAVHDINETATIYSPYTPKEIVIKKINIRHVGTLPTFDEHIKPLINNKNVNRISEHTSEESGIVYQVKVMIANLPVIGLVATVFKTNITHVMLSRTLDILTNSITLLGQRDLYTAGHSARVFYYCMNIAEKMNLASDYKFMKNIYFASLLHDVGKIGVKDQILLKPGKLSAGEFEELATHSLKGFNMLKRYSFFEDCLYYIKHHHERPDGRGYPDKLSGKNIPLGAAIISVADSFDAMSSNRPYRGSLDYDRAVKEIKIYAGKQFDPDVAQAFLSIISPDLVKKIVKTSRRDLDVITREILDLLKRQGEK